MKVVHINTTPDGGAGWCAKRICKALQKEGIEVSMLLKSGDEQLDVAVAQVDYIYRKHRFKLLNSIFKQIRVILRPRFAYFKRKMRKANRKNYVFITSPLSEYQSLYRHPLVQEADIIHLHWVGDFVDLPSFFSHVHKPIVWTIHDQNPGMGSFHFQISLTIADSAHLWINQCFSRIKKKAVNGNNKPYLVAISQAMADFFKSNDILGECPIKVIHNGVDGTVYKMCDKQAVRRKYGIPQDKIVFAFSSYFLEDERKGLALLIEALNKVSRKDIMLICIGSYQSRPMADFEIKCTGLVDDTDLLSELYSAADYFVLSSFQEGFAQTPLEAMSCGTPVVAFPCSGVSELINETNGIKCSDFTVEALKEGLNEAMSVKYDRDTIRRDVLQRFGYDVIAKQYIQLYNELLQR